MHKPAVAAAADTEVVAEAIWAALAEVTWAEVTWVASAEPISVASAELTLTEVTWRAYAEITLVVDVVSLTATTALVAHITRPMTGSTPALTDLHLNAA
jgi:hypothetical protein